MKETKIYADEFCTTFASTTEMLEFLAERAKQSKWIRKPTRMLKLVPLEKEAETIEEACEKELEGIVEDTEKNTQLVLKVNKDFYPVRDCAIHTILKRAGINGTGLKKLEKATYAKIVNYCLQVAKGDALIKVADGKVSAVHGGDDHDYCVLDMQTIFNMTSDYLKAHFKGSTYLEGSGSFDHSIVSAMWTLGGNQELLDTYHQALEDHGIEDKSLAPALRLTTSDVAVSGVNLYPMMLSQTSNRVISLGSPIKLSHDRGATLQDFRNNLDKIFSRYQEAVKDDFRTRAWIKRKGDNMKKSSYLSERVYDAIPSEINMESLEYWKKILKEEGLQYVKKNHLEYFFGFINNCAFSSHEKSQPRNFVKLSLNKKAFRHEGEKMVFGAFYDPFVQEANRQLISNRFYKGEIHGESFNNILYYQYDTYGRLYLLYL